MNKPIIRMMSYKDGKLSGFVLINGIERAVEAFEVPKGTSAAEFEKVLLEQAYTEREHKLMDWMQGAGE